MPACILLPGDKAASSNNWFNSWGRFFSSTSMSFSLRLVVVGE
jgi:hypothetical protein